MLKCYTYVCEMLMMRDFGFLDLEEHEETRLLVRNEEEKKCTHRTER